MTTTAATDPVEGYTTDTLAAHLKLSEWQVVAGRRFGIIPPRDLDEESPGQRKRWSAGVVAELDAGAIVAAVGTDHPIGVHRAAEHLARRTDLEVTPDDITALTIAGRLTVAGVFHARKGGPYDLWAPHQLNQLADHQRDQLEAVVAARREWVAVGISRDDAAALLGWRWFEVRDVTEQRGIEFRHGRYSRAAIEGLAANADLCDEVDQDRLIGPDQSTNRLQIRATDWKHVVNAGLIAPKETIWKPVGRRTAVKVPMFLTADVDHVPMRARLAGVDWDAVQAAGKGDPSPLRELVKGRPPTRAELIRRWIAEVGDRHQVDVWAHYRAGGDTWEINWGQPGDTPTKAQIAALLAAEPALKPHRASIELDTGQGAVTRWARDMLEPGAAVILDTETTDLWGQVIELAVIDACTGRILLDTLVNPGPVPISAGAYAVHGISESMLDGAPTWEKVLPKLRKVTKDRHILAYNADYDKTVILADTERAGRKPGRARAVGVCHEPPLGLARDLAVGAPRRRPPGGRRLRHRTRSVDRHGAAVHQDRIGPRGPDGWFPRDRGARGNQTLWPECSFAQVDRVE